MSQFAATRIAEWVVGAEVPPEAMELAGARVRDTLGLVLGAWRTPAAEAVRKLAVGNGAAGGATLVGETRGIAPCWAALAHGTIAHCRDFDDTFADSVVHPGSTIVSTALAIAEARESGAADFLAAVVVGYEVAARVGRAGGRRLHARGFHASGVYGPIISACVAARLGGLSVGQTVSAIGLASSMAGGLLAFLQDGSWSKWLHVGWSAHGGVIAAELAGSGFRGPESGLDALYEAFIGEAGEVVTEDLGRVWRGGEALAKYFPCAHVIQPFIAAMLAVRREVPPEAIAGVTCRIAPWAVPIVCEPLDRKRRPGAEMDVIASLPFHVAMAWVDGRVDLDCLTAAHWEREDLRAAAAAVDYVADAGLGEGFDGAIAVRLADGRVIDRAVPVLGVDVAAIGDKFRGLAGRALPAAEVAELERATTLFPADWRSTISAALRRAG